MPQAKERNAAQAEADAATDADATGTERSTGHRNAATGHTNATRRHVYAQTAQVRKHGKWKICLNARQTWTEFEDPH